MPEPHPLIVPILEEVGFSGVAKLRHLKVDHALITALVERWRPETHTFHFPTGECTITLEDVALQLGLRVDGLPVIGPTLYDWEEMCSTYLGIMPVKVLGMASHAIYIAPISRLLATFPLVCKWSGGRVLNFQNVPHNDVVGYRSRFDHIQNDQFLWAPYGVL
ncbi:serine/threonine-protein phosphatase 7 long form homolog [Cajanus cajan]|uniref:serine/threonine-protein phosphatase 7 long form homolog n=1 Tax=Cajanus cajan TaxID=3821 RepID=UPI0010FB0D5D|nr:serine/threonine-protein phosphatase 7 long form homolog [Cajanus cajan]